MKKTLSRVLSFLMIACCVIGLMAPAAFAAPVAEATIDTTKTGSITLYKYDYTNSVKDEVWDDSYQSDGLYNEDVNDTLGAVARKDDDDTNNDEYGNTLGNGETSYGYAIAGVEFTYLKVADITTYTAVEDGVATIMTLYGFDSDDAVLGILDLTADDRYALADTDGMWYFEAQILNYALRDALAADPTGVKDAMEAYIVGNGGTAMKLTDANGCTAARGLELGLYLLVETAVPEMVTSTCNPFFVSVPMTSVDGSREENGGTYWNYNPVIYPKNETGIVTLEKTVREAEYDTGKNNASDSITDGYEHNATASAGDILEYQIVSTLPTITSSATYISTYTFVDTLSKGLTYDDFSKIEWFTDKECTNKVAEWSMDDGKFTVDYTMPDATTGSSQMIITMTEAGLAEINTAAGSFANANNGSVDGITNYAGYSNYTLRITYTALLESSDVVVYGDAGNPNTVSLTWSRTSSNYYDTITDDAHVYTYAIDLTKTFADKTTDEALDEDLFSQVSFKLQNTTDGYWVKASLNAEEGVYYVIDNVETEEEATSFVPVTAYAGTDNEAYGKVIIKGLEDDTYVLTETTTANGYSLLKDNITVEITTTETEDSCSVYDNEEQTGLTQNDGHYTNYTGDAISDLTNIPQAELDHKLLTASATVDGNATPMVNDTDYTGAAVDSTNAAVVTKIVNHPGMDIPETGDNSMILLTAAGSAMVVCAACLIFLVVKHNKKEENA